MPFDALLGYGLVPSCGPETANSYPPECGANLLSLPFARTNAGRPTTSGTADAWLPRGARVWLLLIDQEVARIQDPPVITVIGDHHATGESGLHPGVEVHLFQGIEAEELQRANAALFAMFTAPKTS